MIVRRIPTDMLESNMYIIVDGDALAVVDPCRYASLALDVPPDWVFVTHEHYDHISGVNAWRARYGMPVIASEKCDKRMRDARRNMSRYFEAFCQMQTGLNNTLPADFDANYVCHADTVFSEDTLFLWHGHTVRLMLLPGHSPGSAALCIDDMVFAGDSVFLGHETALRFPGGSAREWKEISLPKLRALPPETRVYPGHFEPFVLRAWEQY